MYCDVDSNLPPGAGARKGMAVRRIRINASWVKFSPKNDKRIRRVGLLAILPFIKKLDQLHRIYIYKLVYLLYKYATHIINKKQHIFLLIITFNDWLELSYLPPPLF
jgi:hypothetical protein